MSMRGYDRFKLGMLVPEISETLIMYVEIQDIKSVCWHIFYKSLLYHFKNKFLNARIVNKIF